MNPDELLSILRSANTVSGQAGETRLDEFVRAASYDKAMCDEALSQMKQLCPQLKTADEWHAANLLIGQLELVNAKLGEEIVTEIDTNQISDLAALWAACAAVSLGATLKSKTLQALESAKALYPVQWFTLMRDTQEVRAVDGLLVSLATLPNLKPQQALDLVRGYKRWAKQNGVHWNVVMSNFLRKLPDDIESSVSSKISHSLGPSFSIEAIASSTHMGRVLVHDTVILEPLYLRPKILQAMDRVAQNLDWSQSRALEAA